MSHQAIDIVVQRRVYIDVVRNRGSVYSVNGKVGTVVLDHTDVGADEEGAAAAALTAANTFTDQEAAAAEAAAIAAANQYTDNELITKQDRISGPIGNVSIDVDGDEVTVGAIPYFIVGLGEFSSPETVFDVALSAEDTIRYVGFYGNADGEVVMVDGEEGSSAAYPTTPDNTAPLGFVQVTDAGVGTAEPPQPVVFSDIGGNASDNASLVTYVKDPRVLHITSSASISVDISLYDVLRVSALATNTSITFTGTPAPFRPFITVIADNGVARNVTFDSSKFVAMGESLQTTTVINKVTTSAFLYYPSKSKMGCVGVRLEA